MDHLLSSVEVGAGATKMDEDFTGSQTLHEVIAAAQRLEIVFSEVKILLEDCIPARDTIHRLSDQLYTGVSESESAAAFVRDEFATLVIFLSQRSDELLDAHIIKDVVRVEVVKRLLFSTLQNFTIPLDGLTHLETLTKERYHLRKELSAYGYKGITLTEAGPLQIAVLEFMDSGELALQNACLLEPSLVDETLMFWFWGHFRRLAICFYNLQQYDGSIPWFEAALKVAKFSSNQQRKVTNYDLGSSLERAARRSADTRQTEEKSRKGILHLKNFLALVDSANCPVEEASKVSEVHFMIGERAFLGLKDASLALQHFAKGAEFAAMNALYLLESRNILHYGMVLFETKPDKLEEIRASFRRSLECALKVNTEELTRLKLIHSATEFLRESSVTYAETLSHASSGHSLRSLSEPRLSASEALARIPSSWTVACATARHILGCDYFYQRELDKSADMVLSGLRSLDAETQIDEIRKRQLQMLRHNMHCTLGEVYFTAAKYEEAVKHFDLYGQLGEWNYSAREYYAEALLNCGEELRALEVFKKLSLRSMTDTNLYKRRARLLAWKGMIELRKGDFDECIGSLEASRKAHTEGSTLKTPDLVAIHINLVQAYLKKHQYRAAFHLVNNFQPTVDQLCKGESSWYVWQALKAVGYQMVGDLQSADKAMEQLQTADSSDPTLNDPDNKSTKWMGLMARSSVYRNQADVESALENYDEMEEILKGFEGDRLRLSEKKFDNGSDDNFALAEIHLNRAAALLYDGRRSQLQKSLYESEQAELLLRNQEGHKIMRARALACRATAIVLLSQKEGKDLSESKHEELIDEAIALVGTQDSLLVAKFKFTKAFGLRLSNPSMAEVEGREAALIFADHQLQLRDMESAWVSMFGLEMKLLFIFMQKLSLSGLGMPTKALLWAERGRSRLFVYLIREQEDIDVLRAKHARHHNRLQFKPVDDLQDDIELLQLQNSLGENSCLEETLPDTGEIYAESLLVNRSTSNLPHDFTENTCENFGETVESSSLDELWFDKDDALAENYVFEAVEKCGPKALVLEYTYVKGEPEELLIYAVYMTAGKRHVVDCEQVNVGAFIKKQREGKKKWIWGGTLAALISKTREFIVKKADEKAMEGLSLLHAVLIERVEKYLKYFQRLIFCVHEQLALVPFAALFNNHTGNFLIQEKSISYIPSIRVLRYCFHRQRVFEQQIKQGLLDAPFVAGNPEPMGWGMKSLPGAAEEAKLVAEMLGVRPCLGPEMTKEAVTTGLSKASMVLLATHGVVDNYFPHGALILKDCDSIREDKGSSISLLKSTTSGLRGHFFESLRDSPHGIGNGSAAIISDELVSLPGGIRAGLVVLSTCKSGEGKVTSEGLLGLGRALLQGGAPAAILALWEVDDSSNKVLVAGLFEQIVKHGRDVAEALRKVMLEMMESKEQKYHIFHWAPLMALGTPNLKYLQHSHPPGKSEA